MSRGLTGRVFAWLLAQGDAAQHRIYGPRKRALFARLEGRVLEIGPGTGLNLAYYPAGMTWIGVEPNPHLHPYIRRHATRAGITASVVDGVAGRLPAADASVDAVVSTLVLCSVPSVEAALAEVRRVLKPGGRFVFIEHVAAPAGTPLRWLQRGIRPLWRIAADGCRPDRPTDRLLKQAGFGELRLTHFEAPLPVVRPHIIGTATKQQVAAS